MSWRLFEVRCAATRRAHTRATLLAEPVRAPRKQVAKVGVRVPRRPRQSGRTRRTVLALSVLVLAVAAAAVASIIYMDSYRPRLREVSVPVPGLARPVDVLQVTDLGALSFGPHQSDLAELIGSRRFDAVVFTGDIGSINRRTNLAPVWDLAALAKAHSSRVWYLPGNHDMALVGAGLSARGVPTLPENGAVPVTEEDTQSQDVALVYGRSADTIRAAASHGRKLLIVASHTPPDANRLAAGASLGSGVHLFIAGHTHGGQIRLPLVGAIQAPLSWGHEQRAPAVGNEITWWPELKGRMVDGMYVRDGQTVFVSRGLESIAGGYRRFLDRAEIVVYHFVPTAAK